MTQLVLGRAESEQHPRLLPQLLPAFLVPCPHYLPLKPPRAAGANALTGMVDCLIARCRISGSEFTAFQWLRSFILQYPCGSRHPVSWNIAVAANAKAETQLEHLALTSLSVDWGQLWIETALLRITEEIADNIWPTNTYWDSAEEAWSLALVSSGIYKAKPFCCKRDGLVAAMLKAGPKICVFCLWNGLSLRSARRDCRDYSCTWTLSADTKIGPFFPSSSLTAAPYSEGSLATQAHSSVRAWRYWKVQKFLSMPFSSIFQVVSQLWGLNKPVT